MLADGLTKGGIDRTLFRNASNDSAYEVAHAAPDHIKQSIDSTTEVSQETPGEKPE